MKKSMKYLLLFVVTLTMVLGWNVTPVFATEEGTVTTTTTKTKTGTLGTNDGFTWSYNESTKTLTITGEDSGLGSSDGDTMYNPFLSITGDAEKIVLKNCEISGSMYGAFSEHTSLKSIVFSNTDTSKVTDMRYMFYHCSGLTQLDLSSLDTSAVTNMTQMFSGCSNLTKLNIKGLNTSNVKGMGHMFYKCSKLTSLDVSSFNTSNVTSMASMFSGCNRLTSLDVSNFNTAKVKSMNSMFKGCKSLRTLDLSSFNTASATGMKTMFENCICLTYLDLSTFKMSNVTDTTSMLLNCKWLSSIKTPKSMTTGLTIELPGVFTDTNGEKVAEITPTLCNTTLKKNTTLEIVADTTALTVGDTLQLTLILDGIEQSVNENSNYAWSGTPENVVTVSGTGLVTAIAPGSSTVTVSLTDNNGNQISSANVLLTVTQRLGIVTQPSSQTVVVGENAIFAVEAQGSNLSYQWQFKTPGDSDWKDAAITGSKTNSIKVQGDAAKNGYQYRCIITDGNSNKITSDVATLTVDTTIKIGTLGTNRKIQWRYNENTKTLTVSGTDSGLTLNSLTSPFYSICRDVEYIIFSNCKPIGSVKGLLGNLKYLKEVDLNGLDTSEITDMSYMFIECNNLVNLDVSNFNTSKVTNMYGMFYSCYKVNELDVSGFDTSNVTNMSSMFTQCYVLTSLDVSSFDTAKVTDMSGMFYNCNSITSLDLSTFDTSNVTDMSDMFVCCYELTDLDISSFVTSKVTDMSGMFDVCCYLRSLDLSRFDTSNVTNMSDMLNECYNLSSLDLSSFDTSNVTDMSGMFSYCEGLLTLNLSSFDMSKVTNTDDMLFGCDSLETIHAPNAMATGQVIELANALIDITGEYVTEITPEHCLTILSSVSIRSEGTFGTNNGINWKYDKDTKTLTLSGTDSGLCRVPLTNYSSLYFICSADVEYIVFDNCKLIGSVSGLFEGLTCLKEIDFSGLDTSEVTDMSGMFYGCESLTNLDLSSFDTSNVTDMCYMFCECYYLESLNLSSFNTSNVTNMNSMFYMCNSLTNLDLSGFDTSNVTDMCYMFYSCSSLTNLDLNSFNTSKVTDMRYMFDYCCSLTRLELCSFDTSQVISMKNMFHYCWDMTHLDLCSFDMSKVTSTENMLYGCSELEFLRTPQNIPAGLAIDLPLELKDINGKQVTQITQTHSNTILGYYIPTQDTWKIAAATTELAVGQTLQLAMVINGTQQDVAINSHYSWSVASKNVVTVSSNGLVTAVGPGTTTVTVAPKGATGNHVTHADINITVLQGISIKKHPASQTITAGKNATFTIEATGSNLSYQWQYKLPGTGIWYDSGMTGAKTSSLTVQGTTARNGYQYRCVVKDGSGNKANSNAATLTVSSGLTITSQPVNKSVPEGSNAVFKVDAKGSNLTYQWQYKLPGSSIWYDSGMTGAKTNSLTVKGTAARNGQQYRCVVKDTNGAKITSNAATLTVTSGSSITSQPVNQSVTMGSSAIFGVEAKGSDLTYQWQYKLPGTGIWYDSGMTGAKTNSLTVQGTAARNGQQYRCVITDSNGAKVTSNAATLTVTSGITITSQPANQNVTAGNNAVFKVTASGSNLTYQWQYKLPGSSFWYDSGMTGAKTNSLTVQGTAARNGQQYRCVVKDANGAKTTSNAATLTVK